MPQPTPSTFEAADPVAAASSPQTAPARGAAPLASPPAVNLTDRATSGFALFAIQTAVFKGVSLIGQVLLAWILTEKDFGLFALCGTVATFIEFLPQGGLREVLTRRKRTFHLWAPAAFWLSMASGLLAAALMAGSGPLMARFYGAPELVGLMALLALTCPLHSLNTIPMARLEMNLQFRTLASVAAVVNIGNLVLTLVFALLGLGVYSFVLARVLMPAVQAMIVWPASGASVVWAPHIRRWRYLLSDSTAVLTTLYLYAVAAQGDRIILGRSTGDPATVGLYAFALFISLQTIQIVTTNLQQIFFPTLCEIRDDPERQTAAFLRASRVLALAAAPACFLQAALADPLIRLVFQPKWHPAITAAEILSIGMVFLAISTPSLSLMRAQGRFRTMVRLALWGAILFIAMVLAGVRLAGPGRELLGISIAVGLFQLVNAAANLLTALHPARRGLAGLAAIVSIAAAPIAAAAAAIGGAWALSLLIPPGQARPILQIALVTGLGGPVYLVLIRLMMPAAWNDLRERIESILRRVLRRPAPITPS